MGLFTKLSDTKHNRKLKENCCINIVNYEDEQCKYVDRIGKVDQLKLMCFVSKAHTSMIYQREVGHLYFLRKSSRSSIMKRRRLSLSNILSPHGPCMPWQLLGCDFFDSFTTYMC